MTSDEMATLESQKLWSKDPEFMADLRRRAALIDAVHDLSVPAEDLDERGREVRATLESQRRLVEDPERMAEMRRRSAEIDRKHAQG